jgi:hypothetical protein
MAGTIGVSVNLEKGSDPAPGRIADRAGRFWGFQGTLALIMQLDRVMSVV